MKKDLLFIFFFFLYLFSTAQVDLLGKNEYQTKGFGLALTIMLD